MLECLGFASTAGLSYWIAGRLDEAIASVRTAINLSPGRNLAHYGLGVLLLLKGEPEEALQAIEQEPSEAWRMIGLVVAYHALGQAEESDTVCLRS